MCKEGSLAVLAVIICMAKESASEYIPRQLGSKQTKAYFFPWLVTFHRYAPASKQFFGSGSIITKKWVVGSMDCFIRPIKDVSANNRFYSEVGLWEVHSGGIWANPYESRDQPPHTPWLQVRKVAEVHMLSDPDLSISHRLVFSADFIPSNNDLNLVKRSPFGFSMSIALVKVKKVPGSNSGDEWEWKRTSLPIPLLSPRFLKMRSILEERLEFLEKAPAVGICHVGGWRSGDWRLVEYEVVYIPFERCRDIFCNNDDRACFNWPVKGLHVCFKSLAYTDPCWRDQGSALYCKHQEVDSVIAILTSAPTCGTGGLPAVFTLVHHVLDLLSRVPGGVLEVYEPISKEDRKKYDPPPEKDLIPAYQ